MKSACDCAHLGPLTYPSIVNLDMEDRMEIVDYAMPLMNIERLAKDAHNLCLDKKFEEANELALKLGVEARVLSATLAIMQGKETMR